MRLFALVLVLGMGGCVEFPALDGVVDDTTRNAPYPDLVPLGPILAQADAAAPGRDPGAGILARAAALSARAARLRGPVIDGGTRARMERAALQ